MWKSLDATATTRHWMHLLVLLLCLDLDNALVVKNAIHRSGSTSAQQFSVRQSRMLSSSFAPNSNRKPTLALSLFWRNRNGKTNDESTGKTDTYTIYGKVNGDNNRSSDGKEPKIVEKYSIYGKTRDITTLNEPKVVEKYNFYGKKAETPLLPDGRKRPLLEIEKQRQIRNEKKAMATVLRVIKGNSFDRVFDEIDTDGDGKLSKEELLAFSGGLADRAPPSRIPEARDVVVDDHEEWMSLNAYGDGVIDREEFQQGLQGERAVVEEDKNKKEEEGVDMNSIGEGLEVIEESLEYLAPLERQGFRLEGFSPYILVSVLTAGESFNVVTNDEPEWKSLAEKTSLAQLTPEDWYNLTLLFTGGISTLLGIYSAVIFSLTVLYGKTAIGLEKDEEYYAFLDNTGLQRFRAFKAFTMSLFLFCFIVCVESIEKTPSIFRIPIAVATLGFLYFGRSEYNFIMEAAAPIFAAKTTTTTVTAEDSKDNGSED